MPPPPDSVFSRRAAVATWALTAGEVELSPFAPVEEGVLTAEAADLRRFLGQ